MRTIIAAAILSLLSPVLSTLAQAPEPLLPPPSNNIPMPEGLVPPPTNLLVHSLAATNAAAAWDELLAASGPLVRPRHGRPKSRAKRNSPRSFFRMFWP